MAQRLWRLFEPVHGVPYFSPASSAVWEDAGLKGYWRAYFAGRAAPLGPVEAAPVVGAFFSFSPAMVSTVVPAIWTHLSTKDALAVRLDAARAALEPHLGALGADELTELAGLLRSVVERLPVAGRVLGAANAALPWPDDPLGTVWQATTALREHRGDGHIAALVTAGLDGPESLVWRVGRGGTDRAFYQRIRGWTDDEWDAAAERLRSRGWLDPAGAPTPAARTAAEDLEAITDRAARSAWDELGPAATERVAALLTPLARAAAEALIWPSPTGVPDPRTATPA
ncbi:SalK [Frankia sp. AgKG'84/4]